MTNLDANTVGVIGAKRQTVKRASPRALLKSLMDDNPGENEVTILLMLRRQVATSTQEAEYEDAIWEYWFANNYRALLNPLLPKGETKRAMAERVAKAKDQIKERMTRIVLLDLILPNGKPLRDCTGSECRDASGWFARLATKVKPTEIVGKVLSEADVRKLFRANA